MIIFRIKFFLYALLFRLLFASSFKSFGKNVKVIFPNLILGARNISIGKNVYIAKGINLYCELGDQFKKKNINTNLNNAEIIIGDDSKIGYNNHIVSINSVIIGKSVLTANNVFISDNIHSYEDIKTPIINQPIKQKNQVVIGDGSWLGQNSVIIGAKIGKNCIVSANSLVIDDIKDYSLVSGNPAKIIKSYNLKTKKWEKTV
tara:strand:+ start:160 stop:768 length:609 start_codon:yes stop_codon:yes gene_type:complete